MKNLREKILTAALSLAITVPSLTYAGTGSGVRGGGHVVEVDGRPELVDLVTSATCDWYTGKEIMEANPEVSKILAKVEKLDWYLALELKREIEYLSWCMTGKLYAVSAVDEDSFVQQLTRGVQQVAFRYHENAFIDEAKFKALSPASKAYLILHETLHSYLPMKLEMRLFKLMGLVSTLRKVNTGVISNRKTLHFNLSKNEMDFPLTVSKLDFFKKGLMFLLSTTSTRAEMLLKADSPETLIPKRLPDLNDLISADREALRNPLSVIHSTVGEILRGDDLLAVKRVLHEQTYTHTNPASMALTVYDEISPSVQQEVLASKYLAQVVRSAEVFLNTTDVMIFNSRIVGDKKLQSLSDQCRKQTMNLLSLSPLRSCDLPVEIEGLAAFIVKMGQLGRMDILERLVLSNADLVEALKLTQLFKKLDELTPPIRREKNLAKLVIQDLQQGMVQTFSYYIQTRVTDEEFIQIKTFLNKL